METKQDDGPGIFLVEVSEEWSASTTVLVQAPTRAIALDVAEEEIDFSQFDAESDGKTCSIRKVLSVEELASMAQDNETGAAQSFEDTAYQAKSYSLRVGGVPKEFWRGQDMTLEDFVEEFASPEMVEAARRARMEANNGQLPLLDLAEVTP